MIKFFKYLLVGVFFGIVMTKSEAISWYRIQEMFRFHSFHMYGIIGSALFFGSVFTFLIKKFKLKTTEGKPIELEPKLFSVKKYLFGGIIFGLGWALTGACPGPMYTLVGNGHSIFILVIFSAVLGTLFYGMLRKYLPH